MLDYLLLTAILAALGVTVFGIFEFKGKFLKWVCTIVIFIIVLNIFIGAPVLKKATSETVISNIEISEVYKNNNNEYCVKLKNNDSLIKVVAKSVYEGDSNYLIRYHHPKMTRTQEFLLDEEKTYYELVVTDLNITVLASMD